MKEFLKRKNIIFSAKRYGIDALSAMAQGLFASLLIGTIISTLGEQLGIDILVTVGTYAKAQQVQQWQYPLGMHYNVLRWCCFHWQQ